MEDVAQQEHEERTFRWRELPGRFTAKKLRPRILGKNGEELETMEEQETHKKRDNEDDSGGKRN